MCDYAVSKEVVKGFGNCFLCVARFAKWPGVKQQCMFYHGFCSQQDFLKGPKMTPQKPLGTNSTQCSVANLKESEVMWPECSAQERVAPSRRTDSVLRKASVLEALREAHSPHTTRSRYCSDRVLQ